MNRKAIAGLVAGTLLVVSFTVWAAPTAQQNKKLEAARQKMVEAQKDMVNAQAKVGLITEEQAKQIIAQLDAQAAQSKPLTEVQQKEIAAAYAKQVEARKEVVKAQLESGLISQEQADYMLKQIDAQAAYQKTLGFENYRSGFGKERYGKRRVMIGGAGCDLMDGGRGGMMSDGMMGGGRGGMMSDGMMDGGRGGMMGGMMGGGRGGMMNGITGNGSL